MSASLRSQLTLASMKVIRHGARHDPRFLIAPHRGLRVNTAPSTQSPSITTDIPTSTTPTSPASEVDTADARFEVIGAPYSILSVSLSASQQLHTRRGTLVGVTGKPENVATKSPITSFTIVHLDGTTDWMVAQRKALLAWTGFSLTLRPVINRKMSLAHWGNTEVGGRGLLALAGQGQVYQIGVKEGEEFVVHPSNIVAYSITRSPPAPYRLKSSNLRLQIRTIDVFALFPDTKFWRVMRESSTWKTMSTIYVRLRTWSRRTIWGDRLFLRFQGPATLLLQSRAARLSDVLTSRDVNEMADTQPGAIASPVKVEPPTGLHSSSARSTTGGEERPALSVASVGQGGKVDFQVTDDFKTFTKR
ncbi:MAG: Altered inheritance of mitochondria protein 24, mitochondrial [Thelocarpon superellum]|nr:MAG: Altered inheritance of mitochondria protein 24, mitochondrial [Thelocarpon superellum]